VGQNSVWVLPRSEVLDGRAGPRQTFSMAYSLQIVVDALNPHELADWWAETMGWQVEPSDQAFIRSMVEQGFATEDQTIVHHGILVWKDGQAITAGPNAGSGQPRILFQSGQAEKSGKNRIHWDVRLDGENKSAVRATLEARGATFLWEASQGPHAWFTMADPEGNEFCIS
jgi:hypothetical protein